jgi:hypothetical protein
MKVSLSKYAQKALLALKEHLQGEDDDAIEEAILQTYCRLVKEGKMGDVFDGKSSNLMNALEGTGVIDRNFRCILNSNGCEYFITAKTEEDAWQNLAIKFPDQVESGFTIEECEDLDFFS